MARRSYEQLLVEWALVRLAPAAFEPAAEPAVPVRAVAARKPGAKAASQAKATATGDPGPGAISQAPALPEAPEPDAALERLVSTFSLSRDERLALQLAFAVERSFVVGRAARSLTGGRGLSAGLLAEIAGRGVLGASGRLRAHGLLSVDTVPGGLAGSSDEVRLAPGVALLLAGQPVEPEMLGVGIERITAADRGPISETLGTLVREDVIGTTARWVAISGITPAEGERLAAAIARRLARPAIRVDGRLLARLSAADAWTLLAAVRRETDLAESALLIDGAGSLGGLLRALSAPPPSATRVLLADDRRVPDLAAPAGFSMRILVLDGAGTAVTAESAGAPRGDGSSPAPQAPIPASIEAARRQAALDAARAMGRPLDLPPMPAATTPARPPPSVPPSPAASASPAPVAAPASAAPPRAEPPPPVAPPMTREERMRRAAQFVGTSTPARRRSPAEQAQAAADEPPPAPSAPPAMSIASPATAPAAVAAAAAPSPDGGESAVANLATGDPSESLPHVPVPEGATFADFLRILREAPNPFQRATLLRMLADSGNRDVHLVALLRDFLRADHPAVRAAAEYGMTRLFGPNWNRTRAIPKPVQPPRTDDEKGA